MHAFVSTAQDMAPGRLRGMAGLSCSGVRGPPLLSLAGPGWASHTSGGPCELDDRPGLAWPLWQDRFGSTARFRARNRQRPKDQLRQSLLCVGGGARHVGWGPEMPEGQRGSAAPQLSAQRDADARARAGNQVGARRRHSDRPCSPEQYPTRGLSTGGGDWPSDARALAARRRGRGLIHYGSCSLETTASARGMRGLAQRCPLAVLLDAPPV